MKQLRLLAAAALVLVSVMPAAAQSTKAGLLSCRMGPTIGLIVGSHQRIHCSFTPDAGGAPKALRWDLRSRMATAVAGYCQPATCERVG
jgi:Protein of unknown function (DUF992)